MRLLGRLRRRLPAIGGGRTAVSSEVRVSDPPYYEIWGSLESANRALWIALWFAATVALLALIMVRLQMTRPPVVIRVSDSGQVEIKKAGRQPAVSRVEIRHFLALFERFFTELNAYTYESDLKLAFGMMLPSFRAKADAKLKREGVIEGLKTDELRSRVYLTELKVVRDTSERIECRVKGYRRVGSYKADSVAREIVFEHEVILKKVPRSATAPYGVLVEDFHEEIFKK